MSKVPNARNELKKYIESRKPLAYVPEGDTYNIPNHSGILTNRDFLKKGDARYVNVTGDTMTGDLNLPGKNVNAVSGGNVEATNISVESGGGGSYYAEGFPGINKDLTFLDGNGVTVHNLTFVNGILISYST